MSCKYNTYLSGKNFDIDRMTTDDFFSIIQWPKIQTILKIVSKFELFSYFIKLDKNLHRIHQIFYTGNKKTLFKLLK